MLEIQILPLSFIFLWYSVSLLILVSLSCVWKASFQLLIISFLTLTLFSSSGPLCIACILPCILTGLCYFFPCVSVSRRCFSFLVCSRLVESPPYHARVALPSGVLRLVINVIVSQISDHLHSVLYDFRKLSSLGL